jgi:hypothetical protein
MLRNKTMRNIFLSCIPTAGAYTNYQLSKTLNPFSKFVYKSLHKIVSFRVSLASVLKTTHKKRFVIVYPYRWWKLYTHDQLAKTLNPFSRFCFGRFKSFRVSLAGVSKQLIRNGFLSCIPTAGAYTNDQLSKTLISFSRFFALIALEHFVYPLLVFQKNTYEMVSYRVSLQLVHIQMINCQKLWFHFPDSLLWSPHIISKLKKKFNFRFKIYKKGKLLNRKKEGKIQLGNVIRTCFLKSIWNIFFNFSNTECIRT